ncbi:FecR domain-containing protein [Pendulispora rubella]|uniref:FecR domain-containing protein n=1 Tax=Pendulispora rubella TaxID=2741070 RepID=A0ABZ2KPR7_9BACT
MSTSSKHPLSEELAPPVNDARLAKQWGAVSARMQAPPPRRARWMLATAAGLAIVAGAALLVRTATRHDHVAMAHEELTLADGSRVTIDPGSRMRLTTVTATRIHLVLESGGIALEIPQSESRTFDVSAGNQHITAAGGGFDAHIEAKAGRDMLHVNVAQGSIEVARSDGSMPRALHAGEKWSTPIEAEPAHESPPEPLDAKELLARATEARVANHLKDALEAFDELRTHYRSDARAGLAAFELGRLRLDVLGDPAGALEALDDAIELAPAAQFREDAEARRVDALDAMADPRCVSARTAYLERYPKGVHARVIRQRQCKTTAQ